MPEIWSKPLVSGVSEVKAAKLCLYHSYEVLILRVSDQRPPMYCCTQIENPQGSIERTGLASSCSTNGST